MPFIGGDGNRGSGGANAPVRNVTPAPAPAPSFGQTISHAVSNVGHNVAAVAANPSHHAVQQTFNAQSPHVQAAIIRGAIRQPTNAVAKAVLGLVTGSLNPLGKTAQGTRVGIPQLWNAPQAPMKALGHSELWRGPGIYRMPKTPKVPASPHVPIPSAFLSGPKAGSSTAKLEAQLMGPHGQGNGVASTVGNIVGAAGTGAVNAADLASGRAIQQTLAAAPLVPRMKGRAGAYQATAGGPKVGTKQEIINPEQALVDAGKSLGALLQSIPTTGRGSGLGSGPSLSGVGLPPGQLAKNFGKDVVNLPAEAGPSVAIPLGQALHGHLGQAIGTVAQGYLQSIEHPEQHPGNAVLSLLGLAHGASRVAETGVRAIAGKPLDIARPGINLTGNLTREREPASKYPLIRSARNTRDFHSYNKTATGDLVPKSDQLRAHQIKVEVSRQLVGPNERIRRAETTAQIDAHQGGVLASLATRVAHNVKSSLKYNPAQAFIPGASVLALIAEGTIRRPDTFIADATKHLEMIANNREHLIGQDNALADNAQTIKDLKQALKEAKAGKDLAPAFKAADLYAKDLPPLEAEALAHDHYGKDMTAEGLQRRTLMPVVNAHMKGARYDSKLGMVVDTRIPGSDARLSSLFAREQKIQALGRGAKTAGEQASAARALKRNQEAILGVKTHTSRPLSTVEMQKFADEQTGRQLAYASHQAPRGDSAFYTNGQKYPVQDVQKNTMYSWAHGLRDASHEALLQQRVHLANVVRAHKSMDHNLSTLVVGHPNGGFWDTPSAARQDLPRMAAKEGSVPAKYQVINVGRLAGKGSAQPDMFALPRPGEVPMPANLEEEAMRHALDINSHLNPAEAQGHYALIHDAAVQQLRDHQNQISPNAFLRGARAYTNQFRKVALSTSVRHIPGVVQEGLIRDAMSGVFVQHWIAGDKAWKAAKQLDPRTAAENETRVLGAGTSVAGSTRALATRQVPRHFYGTALYPPLSAISKLLRVPGVRTLSFAWNQWAHLVIDGTKHVLERNQLKAGTGKLLLQDAHSLLRLQGEAGRMAAGKKLLDPKFVNRLVAANHRTFGVWTDLTPSAQTALMISPFGMWWANSMQWLARLPGDHPVGTSVLAAASTGTDAERQKLGLDMFSPSRLPLYLQGGIPSGSDLNMANYYSPFGTMNDPLQTFESLVEPTVIPTMLALVGDDYLGKQMSSPGHAHGGPTSVGQDVLVALNGILGNLIPFWNKAQTIASGGASQYATSTFFAPQTKGPNPGLGAGLLKAVQPMRQYKNPALNPTSSSRTSSPLGLFGTPKSVSGANPAAVLKAFGG